MKKTPASGRHVSTHFLVFPISASVDVYPHGKCFIFVKYSTSSRIGKICFYTFTDLEGTHKKTGKLNSCPDVRIIPDFWPKFFTVYVN